MGEYQGVAFPGYYMIICLVSVNRRATFMKDLHDDDVPEGWTEGWTPVVIRGIVVFRARIRTLVRYPKVRL
jgi:hypothetical protein